MNIHRSLGDVIFNKEQADDFREKLNEMNRPYLTWYNLLEKLLVNDLQPERIKALALFLNRTLPVGLKIKHKQSTSIQPMNILDLLKDKKMRIMTDARVEVELTIESVTDASHEVYDGPPTPANDWWPPSHTETEFLVKFTNGHTKKYRSISEINVMD